MRLNIIQISKMIKQRGWDHKKGSTHTHFLEGASNQDTQHAIQVFKGRMQDMDFLHIIIIPFTDNYLFLMADKNKITDHFQKTKKDS